METLINSKFQPNKKPVRLFFFWTGIIATIAYRIIILFNDHPVWVQISWYIGTVGFILYFWHRTKVQEKRTRLVEEYNLVDVVDHSECMNSEQKDVLYYLLETTKTSKVRFNSLFIFWSSVVALVVGILSDLGLFKF